jgi:hypothetical protein
MGTPASYAAPKDLSRFVWHWVRSHGKGCCWLIAALAPLVLYHRVFLYSGRSAAHFWGDTTNAYWPDLAFFTRSIARGELPLWDPNDRGGFPFAFDPQPGVLHPLNWLFVLIGLVLGRVPYALLQYKILAHLCITCVGWTVFLSRRVRKPAALVGAFGASFGCYTLQHAHYGLIWPIAFVPWFLTALDHWVRSRSRSSALGMAACVGAIMAAGSPPAALYGFIVCAAFGLPPMITALWQTSRADAKRTLVSGAIAVTVAVLLCVPVILGSAHLTATSILETRDFGYISSGSLSLGDLRGFLFPSASGAIVYLGVPVVGLALVGVACRLGIPAVLIATSLAVLGVLLALGVNTKVLAWVVAVFPPVRYFRLVFRYLYLTQIGLGVLAAYGADTLLSHRRSSFAGLCVLLTTLLTSGLLWRLTASAEHAPAIAHEMLTATRALLILFGIGLLCAFRSFSPFIAWLFGVLALVDYTAYVPRSNVLREGTFEMPRHISQTWQNQILSEESEFRVWDEFGFGFRPGSRLGVRDLRGYMDPLRLATYEKMASQLMVAPELLARWGVKWVLPADHPYVGSGHKRVNYLRLRSAVQREAHVLELPQPRSAGFFTDFFEQRRTDESAWRALEANPRGARLQLPALLETVPGVPLKPDNDSIEHPFREFPAQLRSRSNNELAFSIDAPKTGWFVINEAYFPGWKASVDGRPMPIYRVDGWLRGFPITQGQHRVHLRFGPTDWLVSATIAVGIWLIMVAIVVRAGFRRTMRRGGPAPSQRL